MRASVHPVHGFSQVNINIPGRTSTDKPFSRPTNTRQTAMSPCEADECARSTGIAP
eukprot:m.1652493 g.1652493  ORF g.1652493 m.1652493 type:complete len:56 (-) comp93383_c0_seq1:46-213(-)